MSRPSSPSSPGRPATSVTVAPWVALALTLGLGIVLGWLLNRYSIAPDDLREGLANVAAVGGIAGGLSLTAVSVLTLGGTFSQHLALSYGPMMRYIIFGGYVLVVLVSLGCALLTIAPGLPMAPWVLGAAVSIDACALVLSAILINSGYAWREGGLKEDARRESRKVHDPYDR